MYINIYIYILYVCIHIYNYFSKLGRRLPQPWSQTLSPFSLLAFGKEKKKKKSCVVCCSGNQHHTALLFTGIPHASYLQWGYENKEIGEKEKWKTPRGRETECKGEPCRLAPDRQSPVDTLHIARKPNVSIILWHEMGTLSLFGW